MDKKSCYNCKEFCNLKLVDTVGTCSYVQMIDIDSIEDYPLECGHHDFCEMDCLVCELEQKDRCLGCQAIWKEEEKE